MIYRKTTPLLFALLLCSALAHADPLQSAVDAYNTGDYQAALPVFIEFSEQSVAEAQFYLGLMYANGEGVPEDDKEAVVWCRRAAEQGLAGAQHILGLMYALGEGVPEDYKEAVVWYRRAAEQGFAGAQRNLGLMYANGDGVPEDAVLAYLWLNMAGANGDKAATEYRHKISKQMTPAQIERAQELSRKCFAQNYKNCGMRST